MFVSRKIFGEAGCAPRLLRPGQLFRSVPVSSARARMLMLMVVLLLLLLSGDQPASRLGVRRD